MALTEPQKIAADKHYEAGGVKGVWDKTKVYLNAHQDQKTKILVSLLDYAFEKDSEEKGRLQLGMNDISGGDNSRSNERKMVDLVECPSCAEMINSHESCPFCNQSSGQGSLNSSISQNMIGESKKLASDVGSQMKAFANSPNKDKAIETLLFTIKGRIGRKILWIAYGAYMIATLIMTMMLGLVTEFTENELIIGVATLIYYALFILLSIPMVILQIKRCHDRNKSGHWLWGILIPIAGPIWAFVELYILKGDDGPNKFGDQVS